MLSFDLGSVFPIERLERNCQWRELKPELVFPIVSMVLFLFDFP